MKVGIIGKGKMGTALRKYLIEKQIDNILISSKDDFSILNDCDFVIETTYENKKIKNDIHKKVKNVYSNTSFLKVNVPNIHFMNPIEKNHVVEITEDVPENIVKFLNDIGKKTFIVPKIKGLIVNRVLFKGLTEFYKLQKKYPDYQIANLCREALKYDYEKIIYLIGKDVVKTIINNQ